MSLDFSGSAQYLEQSISVPDHSDGFTVCCWCQTDTTTNGDEALISLNDGSLELVIYQATTIADGALHALYYDGYTTATGPTLAASSDWYFVALQWNSGGSAQHRIAWRAADTFAISTADSGNSWATFNPTELIIGDKIAFGGSNPWDGRICNVKMWDDVLTSDELLAESLQALPTHDRSSNCLGFWPLRFQGDYADFTSNAADLTNTGTPTTADNPPIPWARTHSGLYIPATAAEEEVSVEPYYVPDSRFLVPELFEPGRKPSQQIVINWNHKLTKGLKVCQIFQDKANLADNREGTLSGAYLEADKIHFDGSNDAFTLDSASRDAAIIGTDNFLIVAKAKYLASDQDYPAIAHGGFISESENWLFAYDTVSDVVTFAAAPADIITKSITLSDGEEHVYAALRKGTTASIYVDSEKGAEETDINGNYDNNTADLSIGSAESAEYYWKGNIDYFFMWVGIPDPAAVLREILRDPFQILKPAIDVPLALYSAGAHPSGGIAPLHFHHRHHNSAG